MSLKKFHTIVDNTPQEIKGQVKLSMDILERIHELLERKFEGKQHLLAEAMGKSEAEVSKWLTGVQNFTIKTIAKLEAAFNERILAVCTSDEHADFIQVKMPHTYTHVTFCVKDDGKITEQPTFDENKKIRFDFSKKKVTHLHEK